MRAILRSARIAPKKANIIALMVRGMPVPDAMEALRRTHKKAARLVETLLRSAIANASHNDRQDPQTMLIKSIVVNQGTAHRRGMPKARGQVRPFRKFLSHIRLELGYVEEEKMQKMERRMKKSPSQGNENDVQHSPEQPDKTITAEEHPSPASSPTSSSS